MLGLKREMVHRILFIDSKSKTLKQCIVFSRFLSTFLAAFQKVQDGEKSFSFFYTLFC